MINYDAITSYLFDLIPTGKQSKLYGDSLYIPPVVLSDDKAARQFCKTFGFVLANNPAKADHILEDLVATREKTVGELFIKMGVRLPQGVDSLNVSLYSTGDVECIKTLDSDAKPHSSCNRPARIWLRPNSSIKLIEYLSHAWYHGENDLPARIWFFKDSKKIEVSEFWMNGVPARTPPDQPAKIVFNKDGSEKSIRFALNGKLLSKNDGLAMVGDYKRRAYQDIIANMGYVQPSPGVLPI